MCTGAEGALIAGALAQGAGQVAGANSANQTNSANLDALQQQQQMMQRIVGQYLQGPQSPYANAVLGFIGGQQNVPPNSAPTETAVPWTGQMPTMPANAPATETAVPYTGGMVNVVSPEGYKPSPEATPSTNPDGTPRTAIPRYNVDAAPNSSINLNAVMQRYAPQNPFNYQAAQVQGLPQSVAQLASPFGPVINVPMVTGTQGVNAGQDALMQMLSRQYGPQEPKQFDNTDLFASLHANDQRQLDKQIAQLQGSAGSIGQRFGTAMQNREAQLRTDFLNQQGIRDQQIASTSFENAQNRGLQNQGLGLQAATSLQQGGLANAQLNQQGQIVNAGNALQAGLQNQSLGTQVGLANAQLGTQNSQFNVSNLLQALLGNQNALNQAGQFNAQMGQTMSSQNAQQQNIYNNLMLGALGQAAGLQQGQQAGNTSLLGLLAGLAVPQQQQSAWPGAISNIGSLAQFSGLASQLFK